MSLVEFLSCSIIAIFTYPRVSNFDVMNSISIKRIITASEESGVNLLHFIKEKKPQQSSAFASFKAIGLLLSPFDNQVLLRDKAYFRLR